MHANWYKNFLINQFQKPIKILTVIMAELDDELNFGISLAPNDAKAQ